MKELKNSYLAKIERLDNVIQRMQIAMVADDGTSFRLYRARFYNLYNRLLTEVRQRNQYALAAFYEDHYGEMYNRIYSKWRGKRNIKRARGEFKQ